MKYKVTPSSYANDDIAKLADSLAPYPDMGMRIFQEMERKLDLLEDNPYMYPVYHSNPKYRLMALEGHILLYTVDEIERKIHIYRVIYAKRDIARIIGD